MNEKPKNQEQKNKLLDVLKTEYRWESLVLAILAILTAGLAVLLLDGTLEIVDFPVLGQHPNDQIFAWSVLAISLLGLALVIYPFFLPAIPELKKISWPGPREMVGYILRVVFFTAALALIISAYDVIIVSIIRLIS